jgi:hypothetical protein
MNNREALLMIELIFSLIIYSNGVIVFQQPTNFGTSNSSLK